MPKDASLPNLVRDLNYIVFPTYVHEYLFRMFPPRPDAKILEPGCGSAKFSIAYALKGCQVRSFDIDLSVVDYARRLQRAIEVLMYPAQELDIAIGPGNIFEMAWPDNLFDLVFNEGVPQHWPDEEKRQKCIDEMVRVTKPGGTVVIIGNNGMNPDEQKADQTVDFQYEGMPPRRKCFTVGELKMRMEKAGLEDVVISPLFNQPTVSDLFHVGWAYGALLAGCGRKT